MVILLSVLAVAAIMVGGWFLSRWLFREESWLEWHQRQLRERAEDAARCDYLESDEEDTVH